jgi:hypothetical protein
VPYSWAAHAEWQAEHSSPRMWAGIRCSTVLLPGVWQSTHDREDFLPRARLSIPWQSGQDIPASACTSGSILRYANPSRNVPRW